MTWYEPLRGNGGFRVCHSLIPHLVLYATFASLFWVAIRGD